MFLIVQRSVSASGTMALVRSESDEAAICASVVASWLPASVCLWNLFCGLDLFVVLVKFLFV